MTLQNSGIGTKNSLCWRNIVFPYFVSTSTCNYFWAVTYFTQISWEWVGKSGWIYWKSAEQKCVCIYISILTSDRSDQKWSVTGKALNDYSQFPFCCCQVEWLFIKQKPIHKSDSAGWLCKAADGQWTGKVYTHFHYNKWVDLWLTENTPLAPPSKMSNIIL